MNRLDLFVTPVASLLLLASGFLLAGRAGVPLLGTRWLAWSLAPFERLVGGEWRSGSTVQVLEWGPGRSSVIARSYSAEAGRRLPVSVGLWYWHSAKETVEGRAMAVNMPVALTPRPDSTEVVMSATFERRPGGDH